MYTQQPAQCSLRGVSFTLSHVKQPSQNVKIKQPKKQNNKRNQKQKIFTYPLTHSPESPKSV